MILVLAAAELVFAISSALDAPLREQAISAFAANLAWTAEPYRLISYGFIHADYLHLLFNLVPIVLFSDAVSLRLGVRAWAFLSLLSLAGGAAGFLLFGVSPAMVGASGLAYGLAAASLPFWRQLGALHLLVLAALAVLLPVSVWYAPGTAWEAHATAAICGFAGSLLIERVSDFRAPAPE
ncbi:rhomboid family intramembrane serine protease [Phaeobacter inhibens]|uniref:rhomboid family intramembrane serine protease n=1 Tax=Phaeobacter inhibens TaxID=221822 RepID=UPI0026E11452|nr:rhomboid family intramembrane serine protease [Phaeobacter inhibens]MDO6758062.1 rhomboid family intramembrane serine protease [Phaeobacter inhibens]